MTLPASPPITLAQVRAEFGAPVGTPLHAFNRGGAWVPNIAVNNGVPLAPPIALHQLCGATAYQPPVIAGPNPVSWTGDITPKPPRKYYTASGQVVTGGNVSKSYSWSFRSGSTDIYCDAPTTLAGSFWAFGAIDLGGVDDPPEPTTYSAVWRLTVNDGASSVFRDVTLVFTTY